jgi:uncharacterized protein YybS (DUF2232 family)
MAWMAAGQAAGPVAQAITQPHVLAEIRHGAEQARRQLPKLIIIIIVIITVIIVAMLAAGRSLRNLLSTLNPFKAAQDWTRGAQDAVQKRVAETTQTVTRGVQDLSHQVQQSVGTAAHDIQKLLGLVK